MEAPWPNYMSYCRSSVVFVLADLVRVHIERSLDHGKQLKIVRRVFSLLYHLLHILSSDTQRGA